MGTPLQIDSARKNGAKSRGPVTPEGKAASSANSLKHGLLAKAIVVTGEAADRLAALSERFHAEFRPRTETEIHLVETMIMCRWRLHRVWEFESATLNDQIEKLAAGVQRQSGRARAALAFKHLADQSHALHLLDRYETKFAREFVRAHQTLMALRSKPVPVWSIDEQEAILPNEPDPEP